MNENMEKLTSFNLEGHDPSEKFYFAICGKHVPWWEKLTLERAKEKYGKGCYVKAVRVERGDIWIDLWNTIDPRTYDDLDEPLED